MSSTEQQKIIQRIKKLKAHAESALAIGSVEESNAFAAKMQELMLEYNLSQHDIDSAKEVTPDEFKNWVYTETISYHESATDYRWRLALLRVLCRFNFCSFSSNQRARTFRLFGNGENVDTVVYMYHFLSINYLRAAQEAFKKLSKWEQKDYGKYQFLKDFLYGATEGLNIKLEQQRAEQSKQNGAINALILYNNKALQAYVNKHLSTLKTTKVKTVTVGEAFHDGKEFAKNYNIGQKLNSDNNKKKLL